MLGIPAVLIFAGLAVTAWRRNHRGGLVLLWGVLFGVSLGASAQHAVTLFSTGALNGIAAGVTGAAHGVAAAFR